MRPLTLTATYAWTSSSRGEASETRRHRIYDPNAYLVLLDITYAEPQAGVHLRAGSADQDGSAASTSEARKHNHYARVGHVSFDERSHKLITLAVESFGRFGRERSEFIDQLATSVAGGRDGGAMAKASARNVFYR